MSTDDLKGSIVHQENKTKADSYYLLIRVPRPDGSTSTQPKRFGPFDSRKKARNKQIELNHKFNKAEFFAEPDLTIGQYMSWWIKEYISSTQGNFDQYRLNIKNHVIPEIGHIKLGEVTKYELEQLFRDKAEAGYSKSHINDIRKVIHKAFADAVAGVPQKLLRENPASDAEIPKLDDPEITIFTENQKDELLKLAEEDRFNTYGPIFHLFFATGLRRGEALGLLWSDSVDLDRGTITVHRQVKPGTNEFGSPKTTTSERTIGIPESLVNRLRAHRHEQKKAIERLGDDYKRPDAVFTSSTHDLIWPNKLNEKFRQIREEMGLPDEYKIQSIRHTHATWLLRRGHSLTSVSRRLGHKDPETTLRHYRKYIREEDDAIVRDIEDDFL